MRNHVHEKGNGYFLALRTCHMQAVLQFSRPIAEDPHADYTLRCIRQNCWCVSTTVCPTVKWRLYRPRRQYWDAPTRSTLAIRATKTKPLTPLRRHVSQVVSQKVGRRISCRPICSRIVQGVPRKQEDSFHSSTHKTRERTTHKSSSFF